MFSERSIDLTDFATKLADFGSNELDGQVDGLSTSVYI